MRISLIANLTIIAHSQHKNSGEDTIAKLLVIVPYIQYVSLLLPQHGWQYWKYNDGYLIFLSKASSYFTITPFFEFQNNFIYYPFTIFSLIILLSLIFYLCFFSLEVNSNKQKVKYLEGRTSLLCSIILFTIYTLQIPCYKFYIQQIIDANNKNQTNQLIVNICTLILYSVYVLVCEYLLRMYSFIAYHPMQQKFTKLRSSIILLNLIAIVLTLDNQSKLYNLVGLFILHLIFIIKIVNHLYYQSDVPHKNMVDFEISFTLESLALLITFNVLSENKIFPENQIAIYIMFILSLGIILGNHIYLFLFQYNFNEKTRQLNQIYELYSYICQINSNSITQQHLLIYQLINSSKFSKFKHKAIISNKCVNMVEYYKLGLYLISEIFLDLISGEKNELEEIQLLFVSFVALVRKKPLVAYVEFKKFEQNSNYTKSYYFGFIKNRIELHLQRRISAVQKIYQNEQLQSEKNNVSIEKRITTLELFQFCQLEETFQKDLLEIIQTKIKIWEFQIQGCQSIYDFQTVALPLSKKIVDCIIYLRGQQINVIKDEFIKTCENILTLKICSMFHSFVLNDYYNSFLCEQKISSIMKAETVSQQKILSRSNILLDNSVLVIVSMVKQLGQILNKNKSQLANYFGFSQMDFNQINNIRELMPKHFAYQHDAFLLSYIKEAKTDLVFRDSLTFAKGKNGFLIPQYLNIYNNYNIFDDFTLIGSLTKIKESHNYLLFDEYGKCIGITKEMSQLLIPRENQEFFLQNIELFFIYMFLPHIHMYVNDMLQNNNKEGGFLQKSVILYVYQDLIQLSKIHESIFSTYKAQSIKQIEQTKTYTQFEYLNSMVNSPRNGMNQRLITDIKPNQNQLQDEIIMVDTNREQQNNSKKEGKSASSAAEQQKEQQTEQQKEQQMIEFLNAIDDLQKTMYLCTAKIHMADIGRKGNKQNYFILDCSDFIDRGNLKEDEKKLIKTQQSQLRNIKTRNYIRRPSQIIQSQSNHKSSEQQMESSIMSPLGSQVHQSSFLDKNSRSKKILNYINQKRTNQIGRITQVESESLHEEIISNDFNQIIQKKNELKSNQELLLKSQSSSKSGQSGQTAIEIVNNFKTRTSLISSLTIISILKLIIILLFLVFMFINLTQVMTFNNQAKNFLSDINLPISFNKYFLNVFTHSWIILMQKIKILNTSQFIQNQLQDQRVSMLSTFQNLTIMYGNFIALEENRYLDEISIVHPDENLQVEEVEFTDYLFYLEQVGFRLLYSDNEKDFSSNLLKYRINFENIIVNNDKLILSLSNYYEVQQNGKISKFFNLILVQIIVIGSVIISQLYFWRKIELYCQRILMLSNRLSEKAAEQQISKFKIIISVIKQLYGEFGYKQRNCYKLCYTEKSFKKKNFRSISKMKHRESILQQNSQKIFETQMKQSQQSTIPLNSRIQKPSIKLMIKSITVLFFVIIIVLYFIGCYLIFKDQTQQLSPPQDLAMGYIQFYIDFENTIAISLIIKSEFQIYTFMKDSIPFYAKTVNKYLQQSNTIQLLQSVYSFDHSNLNDIYDRIIESDALKGEDETFILSLYNGDFCQLFQSKIAFCNKDMSKINFESKFGQYANKDNNSDYLSKGISGMVSKLDNFLTQYYETEILTGQPVNDFALLNSQINTQDFNNIIIQHYLDTYNGFEAFIAKIQDSLINLIQKQQNNYNIYQIAVGVIFTVFLLSSSAYIVVKVNLRLIYIRLLITLLPIEIMLDIYTISLLKLLK
ncbi:unnamed protein product (macronuclear) [Paramecium tetraurelia]|uniref:Transmembrane protein n=1 Tax=Paramecium tetraurelia TaxID=5888 RepID=A0CE65_PARTE|nr:uncharacterized protein GSPATT00037518001 [Paramecium tetraurelia]CAK69082.1 unnamed protein product [Paramecium tetraurelia]|eukprot:XP_001436479.1 hypothetical protein (macronuclear) [Paramecium tetraurelia strain d4-2]